jgi:hypothetical protein
MQKVKAILAVLFLMFCIEAVSADPYQAQAQAQHDLYLQALELQRAGKWSEALALWEKWDPVFDCPVDHRPSLRIYHMAICLHHLGQTRRAAFLCMQDTFHNGFAAPQTALLLLEFYQATGQVGDLRQIMETYERELLADYEQKGYLKNPNTTEAFRKNLPTRPIHEALNLMHLRANRKTSELIALAQSSSWTSTDSIYSGEHDQTWHCRFAADALAEFGDHSIPALKAAILEPKANVSWLIYALGKSTSTNALSVLEQGARKEQGGNSHNYIYALSLHGEAGHQIITQLGEWDSHSHRGIIHKAKEYLAAPKTFPTPAPRIDLLKMKGVKLIDSYRTPAPNPPRSITPR